MRLTQRECELLVGEWGHAVLGTSHPPLGVDLVPVVYVRTGDELYLPIDTVKEKAVKSVETGAPMTLQRMRNLSSDPRCSILVEHYEEDWSRLWWVRVRAEGTVATDDLDRVRPLFASRFASNYTDPRSIVDLLRIRPLAWTGWSATPAGAR